MTGEGGDRSGTSLPVCWGFTSELLVMNGFGFVLILSILPIQVETLSSKRLLVICVKLSKSVDVCCFSKLESAFFSIGLIFIRFLFEVFSILAFVALLLSGFHFKKLLSVTWVSIRVSNVQRSHGSFSTGASGLSVFTEVSIAAEIKCNV